MPVLEDLVLKLRMAAVLPIVTIDDPERAVRLARALHAGGIPVIEVTLRTARSLESVRRIATEVPEVEVGAGTIRAPRQIETAIAAGARFLVSPGLTPELRSAARQASVPFLPGVSTASEAMTAAGEGFGLLKFFPAEAIGGAAALEAFAGPLPDIAFCPTGGIGPDRIGQYLKLPNVVCVGGSWIAPKPAVDGRDWARITELARSVQKMRAAA